MKQYVIVCLERSTNEELVFWRPDNAGYTSWPFAAGIYTEEQVKNRPYYYNDGLKTAALGLDERTWEMLRFKCGMDLQKLRDLTRTRVKKAAPDANQLT